MFQKTYFLSSKQLHNKQKSLHSNPKKPNKQTKNRGEREREREREIVVAFGGGSQWIVAMCWGWWLMDDGSAILKVTAWIPTHVMLPCAIQLSDEVSKIWIEYRA